MADQGGVSVSGQSVNVGRDVVGRDKIEKTEFHFNFTAKEWGEAALRGARLPPRNPAFVGRVAILNELARRMEPENALVILHAPGGMGKTQTAIEFGHQVRAHFPGGVFYLRCAQPDLIAIEITACGDEGRLALPRWDALPHPEKLDRVQAAWQEPIPRLLIFDNCEDADTLKRWRPTTGGCRVLVTARRANWPRALASHLLFLPPLDRADSLQLLGHAEQAADEIAAALGDLPLALHCAGAYMVHYGLAPGDYLKELRARASAIEHESLQDWLAAYEELPTEHTPSIVATLDVSYQSLISTFQSPKSNADVSKLALDLFHLLAHLAPATPMPREALTKAAGCDDRLLTDALYALTSVGLVTLGTERRPLIHKLTQEFARLRAPERWEADAERLEKAIAELVTELNQGRAAREDAPVCAAPRGGGGAGRSAQLKKSGLAVQRVGLSPR